jgi:hypothetical protein
MDMAIAGADPAFPGSKIWNVTINQFGAILASFRYIQVVDGTGAKIQPAYNAFVLEQQANLPVNGTIFFRGLRPDQPLVPCGVGV